MMEQALTTFGIPVIVRMQALEYGQDDEMLALPAFSHSHEEEECTESTSTNVDRLRIGPSRRELNPRPKMLQ